MQIGRMTYIICWDFREEQPTKAYPSLRGSRPRLAGLVGAFQDLGTIFTHNVTAPFGKIVRV